MSVSFCLPLPVAVSTFIMCSVLGLRCCECVCRMQDFGCKVRPKTSGCVAMDSSVLFNLRSRLLLYSAGSGVNRVQVVCLDLV